MPYRSVKNSKVVKKGKKYLFSFLFSQTIVNLILLLIQIGGFVWLCLKVQHYWQAIWIGMSLLSVGIIVYLLNDNTNPAFKMSWIIPICVFPVFGVSAYLFYKTNWGGRELRKRIDYTKLQTEPYLTQKEAVTRQIEEEFSPICDLSYYLRTANQMPTYRNTDVEYFRFGEEMVHDLIKELEKAEHFIFLEFFIIAKGEVWDSVQEVLTRKAKEGVEVRVLYDGMCALAKLPYKYPKELGRLGIKARMFSPIVPLLSSHHNSRDHRKIVVIDGKIAYNGGINLSDEYCNITHPYGVWKDVAVKLRGDGVKSFTAMFLQLWNVSDKAEDDYRKYLTAPGEYVDYKETGWVIPFYDDPVNDEDVAENVYLDVIAKAKRYVHIMTPYFVVGHELENALMFAAKRGVDVSIILPHIPDKKVVYDIARSYYPSLLKAGVHIYEYSPGFVHAKMFVSDDERAVVGTINLDFRSLFEHFECGTFIYKNEVIFDIEKDFVNSREKCVEVTQEYYKKIPWMRRVRGRVFRMFGSMM